MVLNWKYQGPQGWFFLAEDNGYFKAEGLDVTIDQGDGSGAAVPKVASGTYDIGFGDINALIEFAAKKPDGSAGRRLRHVQPPAVHGRRARPTARSRRRRISKARRSAGAANDGALKLFPAFAKFAKIDCIQGQHHQHGSPICASRC